MEPTGAANNSVNRLASAASPYLLQHQRNPVDWHEWNAEALERARREDKPIFLSIGYAACHWCHVMAHESFENSDTAAVMNRHFVNIKVDREERPDLDEIYMQATMLMNHGQGGWPMSVWLTPDLRPFFAGTYFPPETRWGRIGFAELCERIGRHWIENRETLLQDARKVAAAVAASLQPFEEAGPVLSISLVDQTAELLAGAFDAIDGGLPGGGTNKFPPSMGMELMLRAAVRTADAAAADKLMGPVRLTLDRMARGGIFDQLAGGIARYSTDREWLVPHFEKMLYDQALVARVYVDAWQLLRDPAFADAARRIFDYVLADLRDPKGGFYSSRDADSEGQEGRYYVWTKSEIETAVGARDAALVCAYYGVTESGNWKDPHEPGVAKNILHVPTALAEFAQRHGDGLGVAELAARLEAARANLLRVRSQRTPPGLDDKVLCEWNGLVIAALARGGAVLGETRYIDAAAAAARFVLEHLRIDGRLCRSWRGGRRTTIAFLSDYACLIEGLIELYESTFERSWLDAALDLNRIAIAEFWDEQHGGFFATAHRHEQLPARPKGLRDGAVPSGNSVQLSNLLRLAALAGDAHSRGLAERMLACFAAEAAGQPTASERFLHGVELALVGSIEIAIVGAASDPQTAALLSAARQEYVPNRVIAMLDPATPQRAIESPLLRGRVPIAGKPTAYVCRAQTCLPPISDAAELRETLRRLRRA
ncbi:MAG: thioredoxin domain-containing protein [Planctomycetes bacterium]|nr:thioredoxin domain-containing protein [Planctomycetota bacterium]